MGFGPKIIRSKVVPNKPEEVSFSTELVQPITPEPPITLDVDLEKPSDRKAAEFISRERKAFVLAERKRLKSLLWEATDELESLLGKLGRAEVATPTSSSDSEALWVQIASVLDRMNQIRSGLAALG